MALFLNRPIGDLLIRGRHTLGMSQRQFGEALGASHRTAERWDAGRARPGIDQIRALAGLVFPKDRALAAELADAASETLVTLGLERPPPASASIPRAMLVAAVVSAAAEASKTFPSAARAGLLAAFAEARAKGVSLDELEKALSAPAA